MNSKIRSNGAILFSIKMGSNISQTDSVSYYCFFRGLPLRSVEDFSEFLNSVGYETRTEGVTGYRTSVAPNVETASDDPKEYSMELHNDGSYYTHPPRKVLFMYTLFL